MAQQGTKLVKVEGKLVRVPADATPDEIDQIAGGQPAAPPLPPGSMQQAPGGPITAGGQTVANPQQLRTQTNDAMLRSGNYSAFAEAKENDPARKAAEASGMRWSGLGMNPMTNLKFMGGMIPGTLAGGAAGRYIGGPKYGNIGAGLGSLIGGLYTGGRAASDQPIFSPAIKNLLSLSRWGKALGALAEEPGNLPGAAREAAGGTAATTGPAGGSTETALGSQAGPSAPKNAGELSATVQRVRSGQAPGTAANPTIYTPESLASEQGMSTAALGKGGFNLTIPPEQQRIMQMVAEGKVPMGQPKTQGFESLFSKTPFPEAPAATPQPPSGTSPSFGEPEGPLDAAIRGAAGQNPVIKSTDRAMAGEMPAKIKFMNAIRKKAQEGAK